MRYKEKKIKSKFNNKQKEVTVKVYKDMVEFEAIEIAHDGQHLGAVLFFKRGMERGRKVRRECMEKRKS